MTALATSFLDLPRELRDLVYRNCFSDHIISHKRPTAAVREDSLTITWTHTRPTVRNAPDKNLLCLNKQIRSETKQIAKSITAVQLEFSIEQSFQRYPAFARIDDYFSPDVTDKFVNIQRLELLIDMSRLSAPLVAVSGLYEILAAFPHLQHLTVEVHCDSEWLERCFPAGKILKASDLFGDHEFSRLGKITTIEKLVIVCNAFELHGSELANGAPWGIRLLKNPPWLHCFNATSSTNERYAWHGLELESVGQTYTIEQVFYEARCRLAQWVSSSAV